MTAVRVLKTSDPDEYTRWVNAYICYPRGFEVDGPGRLSRPAQATTTDLTIIYTPPTADELAEAVMEEVK